MREVLDANVFYSTWVTDVLLSFADADLYEPAWSDRIMGEVRNHLPHVWSRATQEGVDKYLAILDRAFPEASVTDWESLERVVELPDSDDRHVVAAALKARADVIVTSNLKDFPAEALNPLRLRAVSPDDFLSELFDEDPQEATAAMRLLVTSKRHPSRTMREESERLRRLGLARFAGRLDAMAR